MKNLCFCYIVDGNEEQQRMMAVSLQSLKKCYGKYSPRVYVISLEEKGTPSGEKIRQIAENAFKGVVVNYFDKRICGIIQFPQKAQNGDYLGFNSLSRFFLPYVIEEEKVYYVDNDIIFVRDIYHKITNFDSDRVLMRIWNNHIYRREHPYDHPNAGFLYINCKLWREHKEIFSEILKYYVENNETIKYMNQSCYIWLITEKYKNLCLVENDININTRRVFDTVEIFHGFGHDKMSYWRSVEELHALKNNRL